MLFEEISVVGLSVWGICHHGNVFREMSVGELS